jgi:3-deoxy-7-phosphoheptulonate synthase
MKTHLIEGQERMVIGVIGDVRQLDPAALERLSGVERVVRILQPFKLASRTYLTNGSHVTIGGDGAAQAVVGGKKLAIIAGPCSVEGRDMLVNTAVAVRQHGAVGLRGGAFKPRTSPYSFQGMGEEGLKLLAEARRASGLPVVTEVPAPEKVDLVYEYSDVFQVGSRNMQNYSLLQEVGRTDKPVLLKRGMWASIEEWLMAAEYVLARGNHRVILCERGIRTFETMTRNTLDLSAVPVVKRLSHLPVLIDPSHATGHAQLVPSMALAAVAAGADGLLLEVHPCPAQAMCDGGQSLALDEFASLIEVIRPVAAAVGREL